MKKLLSLMCSSILAVMVSASMVAGGPTDDAASADTSAADNTPVINGSGFTLGTNFATWGETDFAIMGGYVNHWLSASIGGNYEHNDDTAPSGGKSNLWELRSELGLRQMLEHALFLTYGGTYSQGFRSPRNTATRTEPYQWGAYVGLDYQPLQHLLLSTQILPYSYAHGFDRVNRSHVFSEGTVAVAYVFN